MEHLGFASSSCRDCRAVEQGRDIRNGSVGLHPLLERIPVLALPDGRTRPDDAATPGRTNGNAGANGVGRPRVGPICGLAVHR